MKKFILLSIVILFTLTNANAVTTVVKYNNAGAPVSVTRGYGRPMSMSQAYQYDYDRYARPARLAMMPDRLCLTDTEQDKAICRLL